MNILDRYIARTVLLYTLMVAAVLITLASLFTFIGQQDDIGVGRYTALDALGFVWSPGDLAWEQMYAALCAFTAEHKHCHVPEMWPENWDCCNANQTTGRRWRKSPKNFAILTRKIR